jgi:hypothetical protein
MNHDRRHETVTTSVVLATGEIARKLGPKGT